MDWKIISDDEQMVVMRPQGLGAVAWVAARTKVAVALENGLKVIAVVAEPAPAARAASVFNGDAPRRRHRDKTVQQLALRVGMSEAHISELARMGRIPFDVKGTGTGKRIHRLFSVQEIFALRETTPGMFRINAKDRELFQQPSAGAN